MEFEELIVFIEVLACFGFIGLLFNFGVPGKGIATDSIARVSQAGSIWKTWRVQLTNDHPTDKNPMQYGVENDAVLLQRLQTYALLGKRVKLYYHSKLICPGWECSDSKVIYKVEE